MAVQDDGIRAKVDRLMRGIRWRLAWLAKRGGAAAERQHHAGFGILRLVLHTVSLTEYAAKDCEPQDRIRHGSQDARGADSMGLSAPVAPYLAFAASSR